MFNIFHSKRTPRDVFVGDKREFVFERRELPSAGAGQYAFLSQGLPLYAWHGWGIPVEKPLQETFPASYAQQTAPIVGVPPSGYFQGQFTTQPLMDPNTATNLGVVSPNVLPLGAYNALPSGAPQLSP